MATSCSLAPGEEKGKTQNHSHLNQVNPEEGGIQLTGEFCLGRHRRGLGLAGLLICGIKRRPRDRDILSQSSLLLSDIMKGFMCHVGLLHHGENASPVAALS
jgi:hypothetical protein